MKLEKLKRIWEITLWLAVVVWIILIVGAYQKRLWDPDALLAEGIQLRDKKQWKAAEEKFSKLIEKNPTSGLAGQAQYFLATVKYLRGDWKESIVAFDRLVRRYPDSPFAAEGYFHLALCYENLHQPEERKKVLRELFRGFPKSPWAGYARQRWGQR